MQKFLLVCDMIFYGIACYLSIIKPYEGIRFLCIYGIFINLLRLFTAILTGMLITAFLELLGFLLPPLIPILLLIPTLLLIYNIFKNFILIITGFFCYVILLYMPDISNIVAIKLGFSSSGLDIAIFLLGVVFISSILYIFRKLGFKNGAISFCVIGLPAYIVFLLFPKNGDSHSHDDFANDI